MIKYGKITAHKGIPLSLIRRGTGFRGMFKPMYLPTLDTNTCKGDIRFNKNPQIQEKKNPQKYLNAKVYIV